MKILICDLSSISSSPLGFTLAFGPFALAFVFRFFAAATGLVFPDRDRPAAGAATAAGAASSSMASRSVGSSGDEEVYDSSNQPANTKNKTKKQK